MFFKPTRRRQILYGIPDVVWNTTFGVFFPLMQVIGFTFKKSINGRALCEQKYVAVLRQRGTLRGSCEPLMNMAH
jgi:hypothetical protein